MKILVGAALCAAVMAAPAFADEVYRWVDEDGVVHYSDTPRDGAEKVEVRDPQTFSGRAALNATPTARDATPVVESGPAVVYRSVRIATPAHDAVAWNTGGELTVEVAVEPALNVAAGHRVMVYLDGARVAGTPMASTSLKLSGVVRGTYELYATVVDGSGTHLAQSDPITFHVRQTSIQNPQRRP
jgi:hypothetical protein